MSTGGQAIRVGVKDIPTLGRATQGVRIMKLSDSDSVASIGIIPKEEEEAEEASAGKATKAVAEAPEAAVEAPEATKKAKKA